MTANGARALIFIVNVAASLYIAALYMRILLQRLGADYYNPVVQFLVRITNPPLKPLKRLIRGVAGWDLAALLLAVACAFLNAWIVLWLAGYPEAGALIAQYAGRKLLAVLINLYILSILAQAVMSWINPGRYNPVTAVLWRMNDPVLRPVRKVLPPIGGTLDLSPLVVLIALEALSIFLGLPGYLS